MVTPTTFFPHLDVDSHLVWGAKLGGQAKPDKTEEVERVRSELGINFGGLVRNLSQGMRERVALATALLASPKAILVDEAFSNLHEKEEVIASYCRLGTERGIDVIFTSQDEADGRLSAHLYVMNDGSISRESSQTPE